MHHLASPKTVLVTGASRGIGASTAAHFHAMGHHVVGTRTKFNKSDIPCNKWFEVDFSDDTSTKEFLREIKDFKIDVLVNNAGINEISPFVEIDDAVFLKIQKVNVLVPFKICQSVIPHMIERRWGRIINISSIWGKISKEFRASYSASKFSLDGITASISAEYASQGILANCVAPGFTRTELTERVLGKSGMDELAQKVPIRRLAEPEEIARFVTWLGSEQNSYITGQNIAIDGGFTRV